MDSPDLGHDSVDSPRTIDSIEQLGSDRPYMRYLSRYVIPRITSVWLEVGYEIFGTERDDELQLNTIKTESGLSNKECAGKMLNCWLDKKPDASWNDLINALKIIGLQSAAYEIEAMLLPGANSMQNENEAMAMQVTSNVTTNDEEELVITDSSNDLQQILEDDALQETQTEISKQSQMVVQSNNYELLQSEHVSTDGTVCTLGSTSHSKKLKRQTDNSTLHPANSVNTDAFDHAKNYLPANDDTKTEGSRCKKSRRVCEAVSEYYKGQFMYQWIYETNHSPINSLAALVVEEDGKMKVAVLTTGTTQERECSYLLNNGSIDECMWGHCDGHAESLCYRFASLYLITEMYRYKKPKTSSILKLQQTGYALKEGIELHFFSTNIPCGFMANADNDGCLLSWKIPFKQNPHCLQCSSTILIGAYLGIQGCLSHLFSKPVYISSITIPHCKDVTTSKGAEIRKHFESFSELLDKTADSDDYKFHIPNVEIADIELKEHFPNCFKNRSSQLIYRQAENKITQAAGSIADKDSNRGPHVVIFSLKSRMDDKFCKNMTSQLKDATKEFKDYCKEMQLNSLKKAQQRLCVALNPSKALEKLKASVIEKMAGKDLITHYRSGSEMEQHKSITHKVTEQVNELKNSLCNTMKKFETACNIKIVKESLPLRIQKLETDSHSLIKCLDCLNKSMNEFENDTKSIADVLVNCHYYQETLDVLEKYDTRSCNSQDLMGCDWARYLRVMNNDVYKDEGQQQQLSSDNKSHVLDYVDGNTAQESQEESQKGIIKQKSHMNLCVHDSVQQVSNSPSLPSLLEQQQHCSSDDEQIYLPYHAGVHNPVQQVSSSPSLPSLREDMNQQQHCSSDDDEDDVLNNSMPDSRSKENEIPNNEEANVLESVNEQKDESQTKSEERRSQNSVHQVSSLASSQQDKDEQKQGDHHDGQVTPEVVSRPVYSSNIEELQSQKETVVQEESQEETVPATRENLLPYSSIPGIVTENVGQRTTATVVTVHRSTTVHVVEVRRTGVVSNVIKSPLMIVMFVLFAIIIICAISGINWSNTTFYYFTKYVNA